MTGIVVIAMAVAVIVRAERADTAVVKVRIVILM